jgi:hypothetical protein
MAAHAQITDVVKKDDASHARFVGWFDQNASHQDVRAARFVNYGRTKQVVSLPKELQFLRSVAAFQARASAHNDPSRLPSRVGINDFDSVHISRAFLLVRHRWPGVYAVVNDLNPDIS